MQVDTTIVDQVTDPRAKVLAAELLMEEARQLLSELGKMRASAVQQLVQDVGGSETARQLGIARPNVYRAIRKGSVEEVLAVNRQMGRASAIDPGRSAQGELPDGQPLVARLAENARLMRHVAEGKTPSIPLGAVGARLLADLLNEAIEALAPRAEP